MKNFLPFAFLFLCFTANAQEQASTSKSLFSLNFLLPGVEYETALSNKTTLDFRLGTGFAYATGMYRETEFGVFLNFFTQYRYFYNFQNRLEKGKNINNNSGNFIALHGGIFNGNPIIGTLESAQDYSVEVGPVWGMQRVYKSGFKLNLHLGLGYLFNDLGDSAFSPLIGFSLGWLIAD